MRFMNSSLTIMQIQLKSSEHWLTRHKCATEIKIILPDLSVYGSPFIHISPVPEHMSMALVASMYDSVWNTRRAPSASRRMQSTLLRVWF